MILTKMSDINEEITIRFPKEKENITWEKRVPHSINSANYLGIKEKAIKKVIPAKKDNREIVKDIYKIQQYVFNRELELKTLLSLSADKKSKIIERLKILLLIINENMIFYTDKTIVNDTIHQTNILIQKISTSISTEKTIKIQKASAKTQKELELENALTKIKKQINTHNMSEADCNNVFNRLKGLKKEIELNKQFLSGIDNISTIINQINTYLKKLEQKLSTSIPINKEIESLVAKTNSNESGPTQREIEIQKELENLIIQTKRKDLTLIEIEKLQDDFLKLKNYINDKSNTFSNSNNISTIWNRIIKYQKKLNNQYKNSKNDTSKKIELINSVNEKTTTTQYKNERIKTILPNGIKILR